MLCSVTFTITSGLTRTWGLCEMEKVCKNMKAWVSYRKPLLSLCVQQLNRSLPVKLWIEILEKFLECLEARDCLLTFERYCKPWLSHACCLFSICTFNGLLPEVYHDFFVKMYVLSYTRRLRTHTNWEIMTLRVRRRLAIKKHYDPWGSYYAI